MSTADTTAEDEAQIRAAHARAQQHDALWAAQGAELTRTYGGEWVAFRGGEIVARSKDPDDLDGRLERLGIDRSSLLIRFIPPDDWDFAF